MLASPPPVGGYSPFPMNRQAVQRAATPGGQGLAVQTNSGFGGLQNPNSPYEQQQRMQSINALVQLLQRSGQR